jgi:hypothetical protein
MDPSHEKKKWPQQRNNQNPNCVAAPKVLLVNQADKKIGRG